MTMIRVPRSRFFPIFAAALAVAVAMPAVAAPARRLVAEGNEAYAAGDYEKALSLYEEASVEVPESAQLYFNRGAARYRQENYERAKEAFRAAALRSKQPELSARAKYNLGNCAFRQAERQRDSDLAKALEHCQEAISFYQEAHDLDPESRKAAENIEIVRLYVKVLLDEQQKQQEQQQQQQGDDLVQKLQKLIERQRELTARNEQHAAEKPDPATPDRAQQWREDVEALAGEQGVLRDDTQTVHEEIEQRRSGLEQAAAQAQPPAQDPNQPQQPSPEQLAAQAGKLELAGGHVVSAIGNQQAAAAQLAAAAQQTAAKNQEAAAASLEEAVKALADPNQQQQQQGGDQQQNQDQQEQQDQQQDRQDGEQNEEQQDGEEQRQEEEQSPSQAEQGEEESEEERQARARLERAEDILEEEEKRRRPVRPLRGVPVDRDW